MGMAHMGGATEELPDTLAEVCEGDKCDGRECRRILWHTVPRVWLVITTEGHHGPELEELVGAGPL